MMSLLTWQLYWPASHSTLPKWHLCRGETRNTVCNKWLLAERIVNLKGRYRLCVLCASYMRRLNLTSPWQGQTAKRKGEQHGKGAD